MKEIQKTQTLKSINIPESKHLFWDNDALSDFLKAPENLFIIKESVDSFLQWKNKNIVTLSPLFR